jgi:hypothetical protein
MRPDCDPAELCLPTLADEAVVEIHHFLNDVLLRFEAHYGGQIHRFYQDRSRENLVQADLFRSHNPDEPPF